MSPLPQEESFDFSKYRVKLPESDLPNQTETPNNYSKEISLNKEPPLPDKPFEFSKYRVKEPPSRLQEVGRHTARTAARVTESILGFPGDLVQFVKSTSEYLPEPPEALKREPNIIQRAGKKALESLPTSNDIKQFTSYITSGFTDPQSASEELGDEVSSLATVLVSPSKAVSGFPALLKTLGSSVGKSIAVKGAGKGAELLGANQTTKTGVELATLFLSGLYAPKTAEKFVGEQYTKARSEIPTGTLINTKGLGSTLEKVESELSKGISTNTKEEVKKAVSELKAKASGGAMEADELVQSFHDINERISSKKLFDELTTSERKLLKNRYDLLKTEVEKEIAKYGKNNPKFYNTWKSANEGFATIAQSKKFSNFLQSKIGKIPNHLAGSIALDMFLGHPAAVPAVGGAYSAVKVGELLYRVAKSPVLRDHYMKAILEIGNENLPGFVKHLKVLDNESKKINQSQ